MKNIVEYDIATIAAILALWQTGDLCGVYNTFGVVGIGFSNPVNRKGVNRVQKRDRWMLPFLTLYVSDLRLWWDKQAVGGDTGSTGAFPAFLDISKCVCCAA